MVESPVVTSAPFKGISLPSRYTELMYFTFDTSVTWAPAWLKVKQKSSSTMNAFIYKFQEVQMVKSGKIIQILF